MDIDESLYLAKTEDGYSIVFKNDDTSLSISTEEAGLIFACPECVYDVIIEKTRKFKFSTAEDNYNINVGSY